MRNRRKATAERMSAVKADIVRVYIDEEPVVGDDGRGIAGQGNTSYKSLAITSSMTAHDVLNQVAKKTMWTASSGKIHAGHD